MVNDNEIEENNQEPQESEEKSWKDLTALPDVLAVNLFRIFKRVEKSMNDAEGKAQKNYLQGTMKEIRQFAEKLNEKYTPPPPRTIQDALEYAKSRKFTGTYVALLDEDEHLVKVLIVEKGEVWSEMPTLKLEERIATVNMSSQYLVIEGSDFGVTETNKAGGKIVPKKAVKAVAFAYNGEKILNL